MSIPSCLRLSILLASLALTACGGGGGGGAPGSSGDPAGGTPGGGTSGGGSLTGPSSTPFPCAPNLCVSFTYSPMTATRLLTGGMLPDSTQALAGLSAHYTLVSGSLPTGMSLDPTTGAVHGTPTANGFFDAQVRLTVSGYSGALTTHVGTEVVDPALSFNPGSTTISTDAREAPDSVDFYVVGTPLHGQALSLQGRGTGGEVMDGDAAAAGHFVYSLVGDEPLPPGLSLDAATGTIAGTPTQAGVWVVQMQAVSTTSAGTSTFTGYAAIPIGPVIQEYRGQPAAAHVQMALHASPGVTVTSSGVYGYGSLYSDLLYDPATGVMTIVPGVVPSTAPVGAYGSGTTERFITPDGNIIEDGYIQVIN